jgi:hypothetical protein
MDSITSAFVVLRPLRRFLTLRHAIRPAARARTQWQPALSFSAPVDKPERGPAVTIRRRIPSRSSAAPRCAALPRHSPHPRRGALAAPADDKGDAREDGRCDAQAGSGPIPAIPGGQFGRHGLGWEGRIEQPEIRGHEVNQQHQGPHHAHDRQRPQQAACRRWLIAEYAVMASNNTEASSNGNTVTPVTGPEVANTRRNAAGSIPRQPGTIKVWLTRAPPANAEVTTTAVVSMMRAARPCGASPQERATVFGVMAMANTAVSSSPPARHVPVGAGFRHRTGRAGRGHSEEPGGTARFPRLAFGTLAGFTAGWLARLQAVTPALSGSSTARLSPRVGVVPGGSGPRWPVVRMVRAGRGYGPGSRRAGSGRVAGAGSAHPRGERGGRGRGSVGAAG